jgi:hypothetical protein
MSFVLLRDLCGPLDRTIKEATKITKEHKGHKGLLKKQINYKCEALQTMRRLFRGLFL